MADTQWSRFEVFLTEESGRPPEHVGSVHAPDKELALLSARNVFVRRPHCHELWVAPASRILFRTAEELCPDGGVTASAGKSTEKPADYLVFRKSSHRTPLLLDCRLEATSVEEALLLAASRQTDGLAVMWAAVPQAAIERSEAEDIESFFAPALDKSYKLHSEFRTVAQIKELRKRQ